MTTPGGCLRVLTQTLMRLAHNGDVEGFSAYVRGNAFLAAVSGLHPGRRQSAMRGHARAEALCERKARHPLVQPGPNDAKGPQKVNWRNPAMRAKLAAAYVMAGGDDERAARMRRVSLGSARLAKKRPLRAAAIGPPALSGPQAAIRLGSSGVRANLERPASRAARWLLKAVESRPPVALDGPGVSNRRGAMERRDPTGHEMTRPSP
jgi:hypothetical protein